MNQCHFFHIKFGRTRDYHFFVFFRRQVEGVDGSRHEADDHGVEYAADEHADNDEPRLDDRIRIRRSLTKTNGHRLRDGAEQRASVLVTKAYTGHLNSHKRARAHTHTGAHKHRYTYTYT